MNSYLRIIDVNLNRLREGLRVLEDICRLFLEDNDLTSSIKRLRHLLRELESPSLIFNRNSEEDLGRDINPQSEFQRKNWHDLTLSSAKRTQEASRALEEVYKTLDINKSKLVKNIRFELYDIEKRRGERRYAK